MQTSYAENGYCLRLSNGQGWHIIGAGGARAWVEKLASIMELKTCPTDGEVNGYPKLIVVRRDRPGGIVDQRLRGEVAKTGWRAGKPLSLQLWTHPDVPDVVCETLGEEGPDRDPATMRLALRPIYERAIRSGGLPFHAGLLERDGVGILLAGPSEVGKSTCCRRVSPSWRVACDDEVLIVHDDHKKQYLAHPLPTWSEFKLSPRPSRTWSVEKHIQLHAIFFLEQSSDDEVFSIGQGKTVIFVSRFAGLMLHRPLWRHTPVDEEEAALRKRLFENACELAKHVPAFILRVSLTGRFWEKIEKVLSELPKAVDAEEVSMS